MHTPSKKNHLILLTIVYWLAAPLLMAHAAITQFAQHGILLWNDKNLLTQVELDILKTWLLNTPLTLLFVWWALKNYPGRVFLFRINYERPIFGAFFWFLTIANISATLIFALDSIRRGYTIDVIDSLFSCYMILLYNAVLQARKKCPLNNCTP